MKKFQIIIFSLFIITCKNPAEIDYSEELVGTNWSLLSFTISDTTIYSDDFIIWDSIEKYSIGFNWDDTLYCQISTNSVSGTYKCLSREQIEITLTFTTFINTPADGYSDVFWDALSSTTSYELENDTLRLFYNQNGNFLTFLRDDS